MVEAGNHDKLRPRRLINDGVGELAGNDKPEFSFDTRKAAYEAPVRPLHQSREQIQSQGQASAPHTNLGSPEAPFEPLA